MAQDIFYFLREQLGLAFVQFVKGTVKLNDGLSWSGNVESFNLQNVGSNLGHVSGDACVLIRNTDWYQQE